MLINVLQPHKIAVGLIYSPHFYTPQTNTSPIECWQVLLHLTVYIIIAFITKRTACHSVRRYSTDMSHYAVSYLAPPLTYLPRRYSQDLPSTLRYVSNYRVSHT